LQDFLKAYRSLSSLATVVLLGMLSQPLFLDGFRQLGSLNFTVWESLEVLFQDDRLVGQNIEKDLVLLLFCSSYLLCMMEPRPLMLLVVTRICFAFCWIYAKG